MPKDTSSKQLSAMWAIKLFDLPSTFTANDFKDVKCSKTLPVIATFGRLSSSSLHKLVNAITPSSVIRLLILYAVIKHNIFKVFCISAKRRVVYNVDFSKKYARYEVQLKNGEF